MNEWTAALILYGLGMTYLFGRSARREMRQQSKMIELEGQVARYFHLVNELQSIGEDEANHMISQRKNL